jgi:hypothetical protein
MANSQDSLGSTLASAHQAKRVAYGIKKHPKTRSGLDLGLGRSNTQRVRLTDVQIIYFKIKVQLLGWRTIGPYRGHVRGDFLKSNGRLAVVEEFDPRHVLGCHVS